jgi:phosphoadenosine phosphosulfate reductase
VRESVVTDSQTPASFDGASPAARLNRDLETCVDAAERVRLIRQRHGRDAVLTTSFGTQAAVMLHMFKEYAPEIPIVFIDTGYLFPDTYRYAEQLIKKWDLDVRVYRPRQSAAWQEALYGRLWEQGDAGRKKYSLMNKVEPMNRAIKELGASVWVSGLRRVQSESRSRREFAEPQKAVTKVYPIIDWSDADVTAYMTEHALPVHPLVYQGYVSLGDWHSTTPLEEGMSPEETRFDGNQRECGLHLPSENQDYQI